MCKLADNKTAVKFNELQNSINLCKASDQEQLDLMLKIKEELLKADSSTPIFDWGTYNIETGRRSIRTAGEMVDSIERRIVRFKRQIGAAAR